MIINDVVKHILVCEEDQLIQRTLSILFRNADVVIYNAIDGIEALELIKNKSFDVIIFDVHLQYSIGLEIIDIMRNKLYNVTPVIVVSAIADKQIQLQANLLNIDKYILKPYDPKELVKAINEAIN